jgi:hypothetical protein
VSREPEHLIYRVFRGLVSLILVVTVVATFTADVRCLS